MKKRQIVEININQVNIIKDDSINRFNSYLERQTDVKQKLIKELKSELNNIIRGVK